MYILHGVYDWGSLVVHLALEELGVNYEFKSVDYEKGALASPAYRALNPVGLVPVLETPQGPIFETGGRGRLRSHFLCLAEEVWQSAANRDEAFAAIGR